MEPRAKRRKIPEQDADSWVALPVLSDEQALDAVELVEAFAAPIVDKRETSRLVRELNSLWPLGDLQHVKRVRPVRGKASPHALEVLLLPVGDRPTSVPLGLDTLLRPGALGLDGLGEPFVVKVPARAPLTRPQFELASQHWPTSFHEDKQVSVALRGELFSAPQRARMGSYMAAALAAADAARRLGMEAVGAVVVDPTAEKIIAVGHDCRGEHPLHHAVMVCIDLVARSQGGGAFSFHRYPSCSFSPTTTQHTDTQPAAPQPPASGPPDPQPPASGPPDPQPPASGPPAPQPAAPQPYICTGYDLYVTREPCVMCAMALVHSRVGRVFYGAPSADGALGTNFKLHTRRDLNHRFEVYSGVRAKQCQELLSADSTQSCDGR
ncbi:putative inactive tRNA-specific adenosine deaminase-like protein 3 isoform X2 [Nelusetta ayraudi]